MTNTTAITVRNEMTLNRWEVINQLAPAAHASRLFGVGSPAAAAMIMAKGAELGLPFTASFDLIHVIDGKPGLSPRGALAILHASPEIARIDIRQLADDKGGYLGHECTLERRNGFTYTAQFTLADAKRAGLIKPNSGWEKYPANMCLWRAVGFAADVAAPDIIGGMKTADQYGAELTIDGDVLPGQWTDTVADDGIGVMPDVDETSTAALAVQEFIDEYGAEAVLAVNGGNIPTTLEEVDALRYKFLGREDVEDDPA